MRLTFLSSLVISLALTSCGGSGGGSCGGETGTSVTISGNISFDRVPLDPDGALDYDDISQDPVRGATVQLLASNNAVVASGRTDNEGRYSLSTTANTEVRLRVLAELASTEGPSWQVTVTDNTRGNAIYTLQGSALCSGSGNSRRDLHAASGWTGDRYGEERQAAPFAILDSVYDVLMLLAAADNELSLGPIELRWSRLNAAVLGNPFIGEIGTSSFRENAIYILGDEDNDTDEYDNSVVQHEFTHFLEGAIFRSDSVGGPHSLESRLDLRTAFSEGFANAMAAITDGSGAYKDSSDARQSRGSRFSLETARTNNTGAPNTGWFNQSSAGLIVYDIYDASNETGDALSTGFAPIYQALTSDKYRLGPAAASIFSFVDAVRDQLPAEADPGLDALMEGQDIFGTGDLGEGETNTGGAFDALPVYHQLSLGDTISLCSSPVGGQYNGIGVRRLIIMNIEQEAQYRIVAANTSGSDGRHPEITIFSGPEPLNAQLISEERQFNDANFDVQLAPGEYLVEFFDFNNIPFDPPGERACFDLSLTTTSS